MTLFRLLLRSLKHYSKAALASSGGIAVTTSIIVGALIIGHSLNRSLEEIVLLRLGEVTHTITAGERLFSQQLANKLQEESQKAAPVLKTEAVITVQSTDAQLGNIQVWGVDSSFAGVTGAIRETFLMSEGELLMGENLAARLQLREGDFVLLRMRGISTIPVNTPFVSDEGQIRTRRMAVTRILSRKELSMFNLESSQMAPYNVFVNLNWLAHIMDVEKRANMIVLSVSDNTDDQQIRQSLQQHWTYQDMGLNVDNLSHHTIRLTAERVFLDEVVSATVMEKVQDADPYLTYFANAFILGENLTPYSFVSAVQDKTMKLRGNDMIINQWMAADLGAIVGDTLLMRYYVVGPLRELEEFEEWFRVAEIIPMSEAIADSVLMPHLPGLSDAGSCRDWDTGIPIQLEKIRQKDEDYWNQYRGTPKAYISLEKGRYLWQNRFGNLTGVHIPSELYPIEEVANILKQNIDPASLEFRVNAVKKQGLEAAAGGVDFAQLFAGLGMFVIIAGLLLTALLLQYNLHARHQQVELLACLGFSHKRIAALFMAENAVSVLVGAIAGLLLSVFYTRLVFYGLNQIWYDIVRTDVLQLHYDFWNLLTGLFISVLFGVLLVYASTRQSLKRFFKKSTPEVLSKDRLVRKKLFRIVFVALAGTFVLTLFYALSLQTGSGLVVWLIAGILMLACALIAVFYIFHFPGAMTIRPLSHSSLARNNLIRNPLRSFSVITLLAAGSFVIVLTAANQKDLAINPKYKTGGTGGFAFMAETTVPILKNLNMAAEEYMIPDGVSFTPFLSVFDDDASCHNLNRVANPRIIATDMAQLQGRFSFSGRHKLLDDQDPWQSLEKEHEGFIPAIADQSVIQWGLGKRMGDTLFYINSRGEELRLLLIGGLENSVLQGHVVISQKHFLKNFPSAGGAQLFLLNWEGKEEDIQWLQEELQFTFRDYGWEMVATREKLAGFNAVENTYLQIFFLMGALGMILGTLGLAILVARSLLERKQETLLLQALGWRKRLIVRLYITEYTTLLISGIVVGALSAVVATMPSFLSGSQNISPVFLPIVLATLLLNGLFWIVIITNLFLNHKPVHDS